MAGDVLVGILCCLTQYQLINPRRMREGTVLALSFVRSFIRSVHRAAETIAHF